MNEKELNTQILEQYKLTINSYGRKNRLIHQRSISNFVNHLVIKTSDTTEKNIKSNLKELGRIRKKELLNDYLIKINKNSEVDEEISKEYFYDFIIPLGNYMSSNYGFSLVGGGATKLILLIIITVSLIVDYCIYFLFDQVIYLTILSTVIFTIRRIIKYKQGKLFGYKF